MKNKKQKMKIIYAAIPVLIIVIALGIFVIVKEPVANKDDNQTPQASETTTADVNEDEKELVASLWSDNSAINQDYVGTIKFESGLINLPFVQGSDNNTYYRTNWETMQYDEEGSIFMDSSNTLDDQNIILIGHYVYASYEPSGTHMFTPLAKLIDKENYDDNKYVKLYLENEVRRYEIAYVYYCELIEETTDGETFFFTEDGYEFYYPNYTEDQFNTYLNTIKENSFYDTGVDVSYSDKLLTLQTCVENHEELREIVVLKEIDRTSY